MSDSPNAIDSNQYERPNQDWVCGMAASGFACPGGPDAKGNCGSVCQPYREGERYYCAAASSLSGRCDAGPTAEGECCQFPPQCVPAKQEGAWACTRGRCDEGPRPDGSCCKKFGACRPVRSVMARRRLLTKLTFAAAIGILLTVFGTSWRDNLLSPGPVVSQHGATPGGCADCHRASDLSLDQWVDAALAGPQASAQSQLCLKCHSNFGPHATQAHSCDPAVLTKVTERIRPSANGDMVLLAARSLGMTPETHSPLQCALCHQEHHGEEHDLKAMTNHQCQTCHQATFHSFSDDHPDFTDYPYTRRTRIYFNHGSHYERHFGVFDRIMPDGSRPESCQSCHEPDAAGNMMVLRGFAQSCGSCHTPQITSDNASDIVWLALPQLDLATLAEDPDIALGDWPRTDPPLDVLGADRALPPLMMNALLARDPAFAKSAESLAGLNLRFLGDATAEQRKDVEAYAWAIKRLFHELNDPDAAAHSHFRIVPRGSLQAAGRRWFPHLADEIKQRENGGSAATSVVELTPEQPPSSGGWTRLDDRLALVYRSTGHADPILKRCLELALQSRPADAEPVVLDDVSRAFAQTTATGRCMKCHTANPRGTSKEIVVNWRAATPGPDARKFTRYAHETHFSLVGRDNCGRCHQLKPTWQRQHPDFFADDGSIRLVADTFESNFKDVTRKSNCAQCHKPQAASESCVTCHRYHVNSDATGIRIDR